MYIQLTTKCNMACAHCCYSCRPGRGQHMDARTWDQAIYFAREHTESISLGGGEPTLHPDFFAILKKSMDDFDFVWMATNGTIEKTMRRLQRIIDNEDGFDEDAECTCTEEDQENGYSCECYDCADYIENSEGKLSVALSQDWAHGAQRVQPSQWVVETWKRRAAGRHGHFEIRNVMESNSGASAQGRAKTTGAGWSDHCVCNDVIIKPDGSLRACGCTRSPVMGDIWNGYTDKGQRLLYSDKFQNTNCARGK